MERRQFLKALGVGVAGISHLEAFATGKKAKSMGLQLFSVREFVAKDLEGTLEKVAALGYKDLEIYGFRMLIISTHS